MKRPSDQAKLLFLGLLRTVSALASTESRGFLGAVTTTAALVPPRRALWSSHLSLHRAPMMAFRGGASMTSPAMAAATQQQQQQQQIPSSSSLTSTSWKTPQSQNCNNNNSTMESPQLPPLTLRVAQRIDVPSIQRCNLATLPENYNGPFYIQHMRQWPELALVVTASNTKNNDNMSSQSPGLTFSPFPLDASQEQQLSPHQKVVAYILGKVEERTVERWPSDDDDTLYNNHPLRPYYETHHIGHITSLAVLPEYRRRGLARSLLEQLQIQMQRHYPAAQAIGLHVRQSNTAATALYRRFGYETAEAIPTYYQDGEDAYFMKKELEQTNSAAATANSNSGWWMMNAWKKGKQQQGEQEGDPWSMPRAIATPDEEQAPPPPQQQQRFMTL